MNAVLFVSPLSNYTQNTFIKNKKAHLSYEQETYPNNVLPPWSRISMEATTYAKMTNKIGTDNKDYALD